MNIKPITTEKYLTFGIITKKPIKKIYAENCWNEISEGAFKAQNTGLSKGINK